MGIISQSNMGIAVRELFSDAAGVAKDLITLPVRHAIYNFNLDPHKPRDIDNVMLAAFTPAMSGAVAAGVLFVGGSKHLPLAISAGAAFQYAMDAMMADGLRSCDNSNGFYVFPSLRTAPR